jgi:hypothetical protein
MRRREFITLLGGGAAAAWPVAVRAQQPAKLPTIGFLGESTAAGQREWVAAFVQRLRELGWTEGRNVAIEYRWAEGRNERFAELVAELRQAQGRHHCHARNPGRHCGEAGDIGHSDRFPDRGKSGRQWPGRQSRAAGRQRHRPDEPNSRSCWQANRTSARNGPWTSPVGDHGQHR